MKIHVVRQGETLLDLTQKYNVPLERILEANEEMTEEIGDLSTGKKVRIPTGKISLQKSSLVREKKEAPSTVGEGITQQANFERDGNQTKQEPIAKKVVSESISGDSTSTHSSERTKEPQGKNTNNVNYGQHSFPHYGYGYSPYYIAGQYQYPQLAPPPYYPMNYMPSPAPPYYQDVSSVPVQPAYSHEFHPGVQAYASSSFPYYECTPCSCIPNARKNEYAYRQEPWKR